MAVDKEVNLRRRVLIQPLVTARAASMITTFESILSMQSIT
jgi:hypothetical protein